MNELRKYASAARCVRRTRTRKKYANLQSDLAYSLGGMGVGHLGGYGLANLLARILKMDEESRRGYSQLGGLYGSVAGLITGGHLRRKQLQNAEK